MARNGYTDLIILTEADLTVTATNTAQTIAIANVHLGDIVQDCAVFLKTPFKNSADAAFNTNTLIIGDGNVTNRFLTSTELNVNGTEILAAPGTATTSFAYVVDDTIDVVVGSMAAKALADLDTGEVHIYLRIARLALMSAEA